MGEVLVVRGGWGQGSRGKDGRGEGVPAVTNLKGLVSRSSSSDMFAVVGSGGGIWWT